LLDVTNQRWPVKTNLDSGQFISFVAWKVLIVLIIEEY